MKIISVKLTVEQGKTYERISRSASLPHGEKVFLQLMASFAKKESTVSRADFMRAQQIVQKVEL